MAERPNPARVHPLAHGLHDRTGKRNVIPGAARSMDRIEHTSGNCSSGKGARKVTREGAKSTSLEIGATEYPNGESGYAVIPAAQEYTDLLITPTDFSLEFALEIREAPDDVLDRHTVLCWGSPYTANFLNLELFLTKDGSNDGALLNMAWTDDGSASGTTNMESKAWTFKFFEHTVYHIRVVLTFEDPSTPDNFELFIDNVSQGSINNLITTKRPLDHKNCPIYIGGIGSYPNLSSGRSTGKFKIQDLRIFSAAISAADASAARFAEETLRIDDSTYKDNLLGYWPLDEGAGHEIRDLSGRDNHGYCGPGAMVVVEGKRAADGAIFLDGHTSFLQADLRFGNLYDREWRPNSFADPNVRYGLSIRCAVLDISRTGVGSVRIAELMGSDRRDRPAAALEINSSGLPVFTWYDGGALQTVVGTTAVVPGKMVLYEFFMNGATNNQEFYIDGELVDSDVRVGADADLPKFLRIGSSADYATDNQTPWSRYSANHVTAPILVEEARFWLTRLTAAEVADRYEATLKDTQIVENIGAASADYTNGSTTVTLKGTGNSTYNSAYLVPYDEVEGVNDALRTKTAENKLYYISTISGSAVTLVTPYAGRTIKNKAVGVTRLGGYWTAPAPSDGYVMLGAGDLIDFAEVAPPCDPDYEGGLVETTSQIASLDFLADKSPAGTNLRFCLDPYFTTVSPLLCLPQWRAGIMRKQDSPCHLLVGYEDEAGKTKTILLHESTAYHADDRWRILETPFKDDSAPGALAFLGGKDHATIPAAVQLNVTNLAWWSWQAWIKIDDPDSPMAILCRASETDAGEIGHLLYYDRGRFRMRFATGGNGRDYYTTEKDITTGWRYVEATVNSGTFYLFIDGDLKTVAFDVVGGGGTTSPVLTTSQYLGWVPRPLRTAYNGFRGMMTDVQLIVGASQPSGVHTANYAVPRARASSTANHFYIYRLNDGVDAILANSGPATTTATLRSHPFVPIAEGLGMPDDGYPPSALSINRKMYVSTGKGPPKVWDGTKARRTGLIPPANPPYITANKVDKWGNANPDYAGTNQADENSSNNSVHFEGYNYIRCEWKASSGFDLSGSTSTTNSRDTGAWDMWFRPARLDVPMVLMGKNFGKQSGNYAIILEPNAARTALRPKFMFWCKHTKSFKYFTTSSYPFTSTTDWTYLWIITRWAEAPAARIDQINFRTESGTTGGALTRHGGIGNAATLVTSGDLNANDLPDTTAADIYIGWSPIVLHDEYYHGFYGDVAEFRMVADFDNDATQPTRGAYTLNPSNTPDHIFKTDPTDAAYETGNAVWAFTAGAAEMNQSTVCLNLNEGQGATPTDDSGRSVNIFLEDVHAHGVGPNGEVKVRVTFYDPETGIESNPSPEASVITRTALGPDLPARAWLEIYNLPISGEAGRKIYRRIYRTPEDSDTYYFCAEVQNNDSGGAIAELRTDLLVAETQLAFNHSPTPRYSVASTDQNRLYLVRHAELGAYFSNTFFPEYVPGENFLSLTSDKESVCRAIGQLYGYTVFFFEEAVVVGTFVSDDVGMNLAVVGTDGGAISSHSLVTGARMLWRPCRNGIYAFTGTSDVFRGQPIGRPDGYWNNIDQNWKGVTGTYWRPRDQAIWVLKRTDKDRPTVRLALELTAEQVGENQSRAYVYTVAEGPEISAIAALEREDHVPILVGGDYTGNLWRLDEGDHDGPRSGPRAGTVTSSATTTVIPTNQTTLDTTLEGLRGMVLRVIPPGATSGAETARIRSNTASQITLMDPLGTAPASGSVFLIGGHRRAWKTGFLPYSTNQEQVKKFHTLDISIDPAVSGGLRVKAWVDFDESREYDLGEHSTHKGNILVALNILPRARFLQLEFSGEGPFTIHDYTVSSREGQQDVA